MRLELASSFHGLDYTAWYVFKRLYFQIYRCHEHHGIHLSNANFYCTLTRYEDQQMLKERDYPLITMNDMADIDRIVIFVKKCSTYA